MYIYIPLYIHIRVRIHSHKQGKIGFECVNFETYGMYCISRHFIFSLQKMGEKKNLINAWVKNLIEKEEEHKWTQEAQVAGNIVV